MNSKDNTLTKVPACRICLRPNLVSKYPVTKAAKVCYKFKITGMRFFKSGRID